ncbi:MAG: hypothetical protein IBX50_16320 [Marinospirillum sp.]|uniref:hypothetical protein n=1 Tax=Marinospirillum sp. TaxID=2183934 RepID=UPI0019E72225|nr:hypothetical protein [Marinospirillum sp.]MBE0508255.1 hypothetical protein [Marinospirillum sp.]
MPQKKVELDPTSTLEYQQKKSGRLFLGAFGLLVAAAGMAVLLHTGSANTPSKAQATPEAGSSLAAAMAQKVLQINPDQFQPGKALQEGLSSLGAEYAGMLDLSEEQRIPGLIGMLVKLPDGQTAPVFTTMDGQYLIPAIINMKTRQDFVQLIGMQLSSDSEQEAFDINKDWDRLEETNYIAMGSADPKRIVYITHDAFCPHCNRLWQDKEDIGIPEGTQVRLIPVGFLSQQSSDLSAYWLGLQGKGGDALASLRKHEKLRAEGKALGIHDLISPNDITPEGVEKNRNNVSRLISFNARGTPTLFFKDSEGNSRMLPGRPRDKAMLMEILGHPKH